MTTIISTFKDYSGVGLYSILFLISLVYLAYNEEDKWVKNIFVYIPVVIQILFFVPLFYMFYNKLDEGTYYRILWLLPMSIVIAYAGCKAIGRHIKLGLLIGCVVIAISGSYVYASQYMSKAENLYHLPQETVDICEMIRPAEGEERVWALFPAEQVHFVRQYTTTIQMPFGRDNLVESWDRIIHPLYTLLQQEVIPADELSELSIESYCNYIVLLKTMKVEGDLEDYGIVQIGETENYLVYRNTPVDFW